MATVKRKKSGSSGANRQLAIVKIAMCERCLQYEGDCECCRTCGGTDGHTFDCDEADTKPLVRTSIARALSKTMPSMPGMPVRRPTLRGLGADLTLQTPRACFRIEPEDVKVTGLESTGSIRVRR